MQQNKHFIGIDLGTACTRVAFFDGIKLEMIPDDHGNFAMPSYVAFTDSRVLVGRSARKQAIENPTNTIFDVVRLIGRRYSDPSVQNDKRLWPFQVSASPDDRLLVDVSYQSKLCNFTPVQICSSILTQVKQNAERYLKHTIIDAVITVPVQYNCEQREAIREAGKIAGLNFMQIISAPAATSMFYGFKRWLSQNSGLINNVVPFLNSLYQSKHDMIIDVGAGTVDVALVTITKDTCTVLATAGTIHLGGSDFHNTMVDYFVNRIEKKRREYISNNPRTVSELRAECERAKIALSSGTDTVPMRLGINPNNEKLNFSINVKKFNTLNSKLYEECISIIATCLRNAQKGPKMVNDIILLGGSTKIPLLKDQICKYFNREFDRSNHLEASTAYGAAIQAFFYSDQRAHPLSLLDDTWQKMTLCEPELIIEKNDRRGKMIVSEEISGGMKKNIIINDNSIEDSEMPVGEAFHYNESEVKDKPDEYAIGIDFGTTYSCVAVWQHNYVRIIENEYNNRLTCSVVAFADSGRLIGDAVHKEQVMTNPANTIPSKTSTTLIDFSYSKIPLKYTHALGDIKRLISRCCNQSVTNDRSMFSVSHEEKLFAPEEIAAMILSKMKEIAEAHLGCKVTKAVVSVPACFSDSQRQAIKDAGVIAGLDVMQLLNEPTAAAIAYFFQKVSAQSSREKTLLIFDLGGGNLDVSIVTINEGTIRVQAVAGATNLGGEDFDENMVSHFVKKIMKEMNRDITNKPRSLRKLREACEKAKRVLSTNAQTVVEIDDLDEGFDFRSYITRDDFEQLNISLFIDCIGCVERCLEDAKIDRSRINEVVLVGGSTRIPMMQQLLQEFFKREDICKIMNADEAVVYGAAVQAAILSGSKDSEKFNKLELQDVTSWSFGFESKDGATTDVLIPKHTPIPTKIERLYTTRSDNLTNFKIEVQECGLALLAVFNISGIIPKPRVNSNIIVTFEVDFSGILNLTAKDISTGETCENIVISKENVNLTREEIDKMIEAASCYKAQEKEHMKRVAELNDLENYAYKMRTRARDSLSLSASDKESVQKAADEVIAWVDINQHARIDQISALKDPFIKFIESKINTIV
ncbi:heat shock 70 kDa protein 4-like [Carex rostrata]